MAKDIQEALAALQSQLRSLTDAGIDPTKRENIQSLVWAVQALADIVEGMARGNEYSTNQGQQIR